MKHLPIYRVAYSGPWFDAKTKTHFDAEHTGAKLGIWVADARFF